MIAGSLLRASNRRLLNRHRWVMNLLCTESSFAGISTTPLCLHEDLSAFTHAAEINITWIKKQGEETVTKGMVGMNLMRVAHQHDIEVNLCYPTALQQWYKNH
eukprot:316720_1